MVNEALVALTNPELEAESVLVPERLMLRSVKVARPVASVVRVVVPLRTPVPEARASVMGVAGSATLFPSESRN